MWYGRWITGGTADSSNILNPWRREQGLSFRILASKTDLELCAVATQTHAHTQTRTLFPLSILVFLDALARSLHPPGPPSAWKTEEGMLHPTFCFKFSILIIYVTFSWWELIVGRRMHRPRSDYNGFSVRNCAPVWVSGRLPPLNVKEDARKSMHGEKRGEMEGVGSSLAADRATESPLKAATSRRVRLRLPQCRVV